MTKKPTATGLAAFTGNRTLAAAEPPAAPAASKPVGAPRRRAQGETVALSANISREDWARLQQLAVAEGVSLRSLILDGLTLVLKSHGLPPLRS